MGDLAITGVADGQRLDFDHVLGSLYQGGKIRPERSYRPFSMIVLCSKEWQPEMPRYVGKIVRPRFDDAESIGGRDFERIVRGARAVAAELARGGTVLVTCSAGLNRSGLVAGIALGIRYRLDGEQIVTAIRRARQHAADRIGHSHALSNETFEKIVIEQARKHAALEHRA